MSNIYDNWERLVAAVTRREKDRQLAYCDSLSSSFSSLQSDSRTLLVSPITRGPSDEFERIEEKIMEYLRGGNINMMGICGVRGVGNTTMAKRIMNKAWQEKLFDEVVMAVVSQPVNMLKIQGEIANLMGMELREDSLSARAYKLLTKLMGGKSILLILDDVWEKLNLQELGLPCKRDVGGGCTIVLTSRNKDVLNKMVAKPHAMEILSEEEEAWSLFREKVGKWLDDSDLISIAKEVVNLPLTLTIVDMALENEKEKNFWADCLYLLKHANPVTMPYIVNEVYKSLMLSYYSIEDVLQMEWKFMNSRIKKWRAAINSITGVYLASAKRLFDQVLGEFGEISSTFLVEASKGPLLCLLNFGQAVSIGPHQPEWLFCLLDMYETLSSLMPDVDALFLQESGSFIRIEFHELLKRLGDSAMVIFKELGNHIASCSSTTPFANGGIHPLTKNVMNYILCFADYGRTLDLILEDNEDLDVATHLQLLTLISEANLDRRSSLYKDRSLKHIFMMNNIHYMVQKIGDSKILSYFGDEWIKGHVGQFRRHAMSYERVTWSCILALLRDDGKKGKAILKGKCRAFNTGFEELYKNQTRWCVPDIRLREDLRISAAVTVIPAYRNFVSKITNSIGEKHIKYTEQDLETYILDLLEGSSKSLNHSRTR